VVHLRWWRGTARPPLEGVHDRLSPLLSLLRREGVGVGVEEGGSFPKARSPGSNLARLELDPSRSPGSNLARLELDFPEDSGSLGGREAGGGFPYWRLRQFVGGKWSICSCKAIEKRAGSKFARPRHDLRDHPTPALAQSRCCPPVPQVLTWPG